MNAVADVKEQPTSTALTVTEQARQVLKSEQTEKDFRALVEQFRTLTGITNTDSYRQVHAARMALVRARTTLTALDKEVREGLVATNKAIMAECKRLTGIVEPEEKRLQKIQEGYDAKVAAEKRAREEAEARRKAKIQERIDEMRAIPDGVIGNSSEVIAKCIDAVRAIAIDDDTFAEFKSQAEGAKATVVVRLEKLLVATIASESEARRLEQERVELARQQADALRVAKLRERISYIREFPEGASILPSSRVKLMLDEAKAFIVDASFEEFQVEAEGAHQATIQRLVEIHAERVQHEAEVERLASERAEQEAAAARERQRIEEENRQAQLRRDTEEREHQARLRRQREEAEAEEAERNRVLRQQEEAAALSQSRMSEIQGIQQQSIIAVCGRLGVREGGTIACIRETLAETEAWPVTEESFGPLLMIAQSAKELALRDIRKLLADAEVQEIERQQETLRVQQEAVAKPSDPVEATEQEDVTLVITEGLARPSDAEIIDAVAEAFEVSAEIAAGWIAEMRICQNGITNGE